MAWITGTSTEYRDMLDQVIEIATSDHVDTVSAVVAGGTGYAVDDIITFTDGTFTHAAKLRVLTVSGGVILTVRVEEGGAYTVDPDLTANTSHTNDGAGNDDATFDLTMNSEPWTVERRATEAVSATIAAGGTGYTVGDDITLTMDGGGVQGSDSEGVLPVFNVDTVSGGVVTAVSLVTSGHLEESPDADGGTGGLQANTTGGTGVGCQLTVTYQDVVSSKEDLVVLSGPGEAGMDQILVGVKTFQQADQSGFETVFNWALVGMTDFVEGLALHEQGNLSYGLNATTGALDTLGGSYMVLKENDADPDMEFWMSVTNRRIILVVKVETTSTAFYSSMYVGFLNAFETTAENPYPLWIQGCATRENSWWGDTTVARITGLSDVYSVNVKTNGPAQYRVAGNWTSFRNYACADLGLPSRDFVADYTVYPTGDPTQVPITDDLIGGTPTAGVDFQDIYPNSGVPGTPELLLRPTPNTGDDARLLVPLSPMSTDNPISQTPIYVPYGELDNCFWISASDATTNLTSEDVQKVGDDRYIVFQNGNQNQVFSYFCVKAE